MPVPEQLPIVSYTANGKTTQFPITFDLHDENYLNVFINKELAKIGAYTVNDNSVVFASAPNDGDEITLIRDTQLDRETNYKTYDNSFRPESVNWDFDKIWHVLQEQNLIDGKILARLKAEIEWRRTHDANFDELAKMRDAQIFSGLKQYLDTIVASTTPNIFGGVTAGIVFAIDKKSVQTHLENIAEQLSLHRIDISKKADKTYVDNQLISKADTTVTAELKLNKADITYVDTKVAAIANGLVGAYKTYAEAITATSNMFANSSVRVTNDPDSDKNGEYIWDGVTLTKSIYDPLRQAQIYTDSASLAISLHTQTLQNALNNSPSNLIDPSLCEAGYVYYDGTINNSDAYKDTYISTNYLPVIAGQKIQLWGRKNQYSWLGRIAYYDLQKNFIGYNEFSIDQDTTELLIPNLSNSKKPYFVRLSTKVAYHSAYDIYVGVGENPKQIIEYSKEKLSQFDFSKVNKSIEQAKKTTDEYLKVKNILSKNNVVYGFLESSFEPNTTSPYSKSWVTTEWIDIPSYSKFLVIVGNIYSYSIRSAESVWYSGDVAVSAEGANLNTIIDLSKKTANGKGIAKQIRVSFRRVDIADETTALNQSLNNVAIYPVLGSFGLVKNEITVLNPDFDVTQKDSDYVYTHNILNVLRPKTYFGSSDIIGLKTGYYENSKTPVVAGEWYTAWKYTPAIAVIEGQTIQYTNGMESYSVIYLDENKALLGSINTVGKNKHTIPKSAFSKPIRYVLLSLRANVVNTSAVYISNEPVIDNIPTVEAEEIKLPKTQTLKAFAQYFSNPLEGKKWLALGDSITNHTSSYANQLATRHSANLTKFTMDGTWVHSGTMSGIPRVLSTAISTTEFDNTVTDTVFDLITIACGVNDRFDGYEGNNNAGKLGTIADRGTDTFYGALHTIITTLRNKYPLARIGYITQIQSTWQAYNRGDMTTLAYRKTQAITDVCNYYGVPVWIGCEEFGFNPRDNQTLRDTLVPDGLHPNIAGHTWYANRVENFIQNLAK